MKIAQEPVSLETPIGEEEDSHLGDFIPDDDALHQPGRCFTLAGAANGCIGYSDQPGRKVLDTDSGWMTASRTLEEVGKEFNVTRERIRRLRPKPCENCVIPAEAKLKDYLTTAAIASFCRCSDILIDRQNHGL